MLSSSDMEGIEYTKQCKRKQIGEILGFVNLLWRMLKGSRTDFISARICLFCLSLVRANSLNGFEEP
jgi:hypothetical protein